MKAGVVASFLLAEEDVQVGRTCMPAAGGGGVLLNKWNRYNMCTIRVSLRGTGKTYGDSTSKIKTE